MRFTIMMKTPILLVAICAVGLFCISPLPVLADGALIPHEYEASYHQLLEQRQRFQDDRARSERNLVQCDSWIKQIDRGMQTLSPTMSRERLLASRTYLMNLRDKFYKDLAYQNQALLNIEKDLAWVEGEMKHYACMK